MSSGAPRPTTTAGGPPRPGRCRTHAASTVATPAARSRGGPELFGLADLDEPLGQLADRASRESAMASQGPRVRELAVLGPPRHRLRRYVQDVGHFRGLQVLGASGLRHTHPSLRLAPGLLA